MFIFNLRPILRFASSGPTYKLRIIITNIYKRQYSQMLSNVKLNLSSDKILSSPFPDVHGYENVLFHESIWENIYKWPNKTALECSVTGRSFTYHQLKSLTKKLSVSLRKLKLNSGDTIAALVPNYIEYILIILASSEMGLQLTLLNPAYTKDELKYQIENSEASVIFSSLDKYETVKNSILHNKNIKLPIIVINDTPTFTLPEGTINFQHLIEHDIDSFPNIHLNPEDQLLLPYSSGTTGFPKGVKLCHRNIVANILQMSCPSVFDPIETTETQQEIVPLVLPIFHIYGLTAVLCKILRCGGKLVCLPKFSVSGFFQLLDDYKVTSLYLVPPLIHLMAYSDQLKPRHTEHLRILMSGAAPFGQDSIRILRSRINANTRIIQGYGLTETSPVITISKDAPSETSGYPIPNTQIRIVGREDNNLDQNLGVNEVGELFVRGPQVMKGYFKNDQATKETMDKDWLKTGDLACYDETGAIVIKGRLKELIKVKAFQVAPAELEELVRKIDIVQDVAVIGVKHDQYGEIPKAFVVLKKGHTIDENEIKTFVAERVSKHKHLGYVQFIDEIPKSVSGKILRRVLEKY